MNDILQKIEAEYMTIERDLHNPDILKNQEVLRTVLQRKSEIEQVVSLYRELKDVQKALLGAREMVTSEHDAELLAMAHEEIATLTQKEEYLLSQLKVALLPKDKNDSKDIIIEIRPAAGGEEAALFAAEMSRMYMRYAEKQKWTIEIINQSETDGGGMKELVFKIHGKNVYSKLKYESGVHRVQRIPETEAKGRVHTSTVTVAVLPEVDDIDIQIRDEDLEITTSRSSGAGGQKVNKTSSAVRMVHIPTGIVVECQDERSQLKNKQKALSVLKARMYAAEEEKRQKALGQERLAQVGTGDRSEKIRTYNFPQDRLTDHRIHANWSNLPSIMEGNIADIIDQMILKDQEKKLEQSKI
jgi:peptide chain release factor 1